MIALTTLCALVGWVQTPPPSPPPPRRYDLSDLLAQHGEKLGLDLCPAWTPQNAARDGDSGDAVGELRIPLISSDVLEPFVRDVLGIDLSEPSINVEAVGRSLLVKAPESVQDEVGQLLAGIGEALHGEERLEVRVLAGRFDAELPILLDPAEADRREKGWIDSGAATLRRSSATHLVDGLATTIHDLDEESCVRGWYLEIAGGAAIHGPLAGVESVGLAASVRSARWPGATYVDLALRYAEPVDPERTLTVTPQATYGTPVPPARKDAPKLRGPDGSTLVHEEIPLRFELPAARFVSVASSFLVPDGKVLWIPCSVATSFGPTSCLLDLRVRGPFRPPILPLANAGDTASGRTIVHDAGLASNGIEAPHYASNSFDAPHVSTGSEWKWWNSVVGESGDHRELNETLLEAIPAADRTPEVRVIPLGESHLLLQGPAAARDTMVAALKRAFDSNPPLEIRARILDGDKELARFRLPALPGRAATLWSGVAGPYLREWSEESAPMASAASPETSWFLDGFALTVHVEGADGGAAALAVKGVVNLLTAPPTAAKGDDPRMPLVENVEARRVVLDEKLDPKSGSIESGTMRIERTPFALELTVTRR
jgi:hypothetical protein